MQHVISIKWSSDNKYILSGSDEMNIRLWKANAAEKLGVVSVSYFLSYKISASFSKQFASYWRAVSWNLIIKHHIFFKHQAYDFSCLLFVI